MWLHVTTACCVYTERSCTVFGSRYKTMSYPYTGARCITRYGPVVHGNIQASASMNKPEHQRYLLTEYRHIRKFQTNSRKMVSIFSWYLLRWGSEQVDFTVWILKLTLLYLINYPWLWPVTVTLLSEGSGTFQSLFGTVATRRGLLLFCVPRLPTRQPPMPLLSSTPRAHFPRCSGCLAGPGSVIN
jgi:hypothetical protein